jgi:hypothetical protein
MDVLAGVPQIVLPNANPNSQYGTCSFSFRSLIQN